MIFSSLINKLILMKKWIRNIILNDPPNQCLKDEIDNQMLNKFPQFNSEDEDNLNRIVKSKERYKNPFYKSEKFPNYENNENQIENEFKENKAN